MSEINLDTVELIIFGDYGVLTNTPFRDHQPLHLLPGRKYLLARLREERAIRGGPDLKYAVMGNKGGVAFGIQSEEEATEEVRWTATEIGAEAFVVCFAHPAPKEGYEHYKAPELLANRKPAPGMIEQIIAQLNVPKECVLAVGNYSDDCAAAKAAGVAWQITSAFFRQAETEANNVRTSLTALVSEDLEPPDDSDPFLPDLDLEV